MSEKILILASGGLDSTVLVHLYHKLGYDVHLFYVDHGNKNSEQERKVLASTCKRLGIDLSKIHVATTDFGWSNSGTLVHNNSKNYYVEMRNLVFTSMAISFAEANEIGYIALGLIKCGNCNFPDSTTDFLYKMDALAYSTIGANVIAPLINATKQQVRELAENLGVHEYFTCFEPLPDGTPCGHCPACNV